MPTAQVRRAQPFRSFDASADLVDAVWIALNIWEVAHGILAKGLWRSKPEYRHSLRRAVQLVEPVDTVTSVGMCIRYSVASRTWLSHD
jgi:hypothetical protein